MTENVAPSSMGLKPNFSLLDFLSHRPGFTDHFDMTAAQLLYESGDGILRYADDPVIFGPYRNSVKTHGDQCGLDFYKIYNIVHGREYNSTDYTLAGGTSAYTDVPINIFFHDEGEKLGEFQTAYGETDPLIKEALKAFPLAAMETKTGLTSIRLALLAAHEKSPAIFQDFIAEGREILDVKANYAHGSPSAEQILSFNTRAMNYIDGKQQEFAKYPKWDDATLLAQAAFAETHYLDIEQTRTADGAIGKALEKVEGTTYQNRVNHIKKTGGVVQGNGRLLEHLEGYTRVRMMSRYEGTLLPLWGQCNQVDADRDGHEYAILAAAVTAVCYKATLSKLESIKKYLTAEPMDGEPDPYASDAVHGAFLKQMHDAFHAQKSDLTDDKRGIIDRDEITAIYTDAVDSLRKGFIVLPDKGASLLNSHSIGRHRVKGMDWTIIDNALRAF